MIDDIAARRMDTAGHPFPTQSELEEELMALTCGRVTKAKLKWMLIGSSIATAALLAGALVSQFGGIQ